MKKILAVLLAVSMLFAFAACGGNDEPTTTTTEEDIFAGLEDETVEATAANSADDSTAAPVSEDASAATEAASEGASEAASEAASAAESTAAETTAASAGLNSSDVNEVLAYYSAAVAKTKKITKTEKMSLKSEITGDGFLGTALAVLQPIIEDVVAKQGGTKEGNIPGANDGALRLQAGDITKAVASSKNGKTTIAIQLKDQVDGPEAANGETVGPVSRGIGTLGNIDGALEELGATISEGRETVKLTYNNATIKVVIDESTGKIVDGSWKYDINIDVASAKITMAGISLNAKNLRAVLGWSIEM